MSNISSLSTEILAAHILDNSVQLGFHISAAESLTGGLLADAFVSVPGASKVFCGSAVTYDIHAKSKILGVDANLLQTEGAVYKDVAMQMAVGTSRIYRGAGWKYEDQSADDSRFPIIGLSTTGVAGPGPDGNKPAGLVYVGIHLPKVCDFSDCILQKSRSFLEFDCVSNFWNYDSNGNIVLVFELRLDGSREQVRRSTVHNLLGMLNDLLSLLSNK